MKSSAGVLTVVLFSMVVAPMLSARAQVKTADWQVKTEQAKAMFMEGDFEGAKALLLTVTAAQPDNGAAFHYLGLCHMKLSDPASALPALERASELLPDDPEAHTDAAWAAIAASDYVKAEQFADRALAIRPENETAQIFKAQALIGQKKYQEAAAILGPLLDSKENGQAANYYMGVCYIYQGLTEKSQPYFQRAVELGPATPVGKEAALYLASLASGEDPLAEPEKAPPYFIRLRFLYQYDTNVVPIFDEDYLPSEVSNMEDGRAMVDLDARWEMYQSGNFTLTPRLYAYQSMQEVAHYYDLRFIMGGINSGYRLPNLIGDRPGRVGLSLFYTVAHHHENFYSESGRLSPEFMVPLGPRSNLVLVWDIIYENYAEPYTRDFDQDAWRYNFSISANRVFADGKANTWIGYRWGMADARGEYYNRIDNAGVWGLLATLPLDIQLTALVNYEIRDYTDNPYGRFERRTTATLALAIPVYENYDLYVGALHTDVAGNVEVITYRRWIYTVGMQAQWPK